MGKGKKAKKAAGLTVKRMIKLAKKPGRYGDGRRSGLYLQVGPNLTQAWLFRFTFDGVEKFMGLGPVDLISLDEARERARDARKLLLDGIDPLAAKHAAKAAALAARKEAEKAAALEAAKAMTFQQAAEKYITNHQHGWKNLKHGKQWTASLSRYVYPVIGDLSVGDIDMALVVKCIEPIWLSKNETASRIRGRLESIMDWCTVSGYRKDQNGLDKPNPAIWSGRLEHVLPPRDKVAKVEHHPALAYKDVPAFLTELRTRGGTAARALEFTILMAARTGEVIGAKWDEIDFATKTWIIPAGRMKSAVEHRVPLSDRTIELLRNLPTEDGNEFVFVGPQKGSGLSNMAMASVLRRMGRDTVTVHGFRSTFRDWAAETTNFQNHIVEKALAHAISSEVEKAYRRGNLFEKRKQLMQAWSRYCCSPPVAAEGTVVPFTAGAR